MDKNNKKILTIFAGRKKYLECAKPYYVKLLEDKTIDEIHLWDYTRNIDDSEYIQNLSRENRQFQYIKPYKQMDAWDEYYLYYSNANYQDKDIIIKCDDDIVYFDTNQMYKYISEIKDGGLYYPNIVNNDVCACIQTMCRVHDIFKYSEIYSNYQNINDITPFTGWQGWYTNIDKAKEIHNAFLKDIDKFTIHEPTIEWKGRMSINMFGGTCKTIKEYYTSYIYSKKFNGYNNNDEAFFSKDVYSLHDGTNYIVPFMTVVHFSFGPQNKNNMLDDEFLDKYKELSMNVWKDSDKTLPLSDGL